MSRRYFGTDGIRGIANEVLTPELAFAIGQAAGRMTELRGRSMRAVVCRDTRKSGSMLSAALCSGLNSVGVDVEDLEFAPTPVATFAARQFDFGLAAVLSASHNPAPDNGIKLIGNDGRKLSDVDEIEIESLMDRQVESRPIGDKIGTTKSDSTVIEAYLRFLESLVPEGLAGFRVAVDAAHGAAFRLAPEILVRLGAKVVLTGAEPDGMNINAHGGATKPETVQRLTVEERCQVGVAFDGDADRAVFSDENGRLVNGDRTMAYWAESRFAEGRLDPPVVVGTVMSNMGFEQRLREVGIRLERAPVGDKYVSRRMEETGALVGGEQSGHLIFPKNGPTGDGLATMLEFLATLKIRSQAPSAAYDLYTPWPQLLINVAVGTKDGWEARASIEDAIAESMDQLGNRGRLNVRASGTQPMIRIMAEADDYDLRDSAADRVFRALIQELGGQEYSRVDLTDALGD